MYCWLIFFTQLTFLGWCYVSLTAVQLEPGVDLEELAQLTEGYSGADIANVCRDAAMQSMRRMMDELRKKGLGMAEMRAALEEKKDEATRPVSHDDFKGSLAKVSSSVGGADLKKFEEWMEEFGSK